MRMLSLVDCVKAAFQDGLEKAEVVVTNPGVLLFLSFFSGDSPGK